MYEINLIQKSKDIVSRTKIPKYKSFILTLVQYACDIFQIKQPRYLNLLCRALGVRETIPKLWEGRLSHN